MHLLEIVTLDARYKHDILALWNAEYPAALGYRDMQDFEDYLQHLVDPVHMLFVNDAGKVVGWCALFTREGERWFVIIIDSSAQRQGLGRRFLDILKEKETRLTAWVTDHDNYLKADGSPYLSPLDFYLRNGFVILNDCRLELDMLSAVRIVWNRG